MDKIKFADVAKLVNALGLGSSNFCYESSSLSIRNFIKSNFNKSKIKAYVTIYFTTITYFKSCRF